VLLLVAVTAYFQTWVDLWPFWENKNATYTHGTLIAAVAVWLVWRARPALANVQPAASPMALVPMLMLSAVWMLAWRANIFIVYAILWPLLAFSMLWAGVGWKAATKLAFPLAFLYFAIPVWEYLKPPLQAITSTMVGFLTGLAGVPAAVDGPYITLPSDTIFIALDCSGAHFLCVALAVGVLAGVIRGDSLGTRILILAIAGLLSMIFNWTRILLIVFAYLHPDLKHWLENIGHFTFGWWVFALDLVVFALVLRFVPSTSRAELADASGAIPTQPVRKTGFKGLALTIAAALALPASSWSMTRLSSHPEGTAPVTVPTFATETSADLRWQPTFMGPTWEHRTAYLGTEGRTIEVYANEYHTQSQGRELISRASPLFDPLIFTTQFSAAVVFDLDKEGSQIKAGRVRLIDNSHQRWSALYTYFVDSDTAANPRHVQLLLALRSLYSRPRAGVVSLAMPCVPDCETTDVELDKALVDTYVAYRLTSSKTDQTGKDR
jgi:exosortase